MSYENPEPRRPYTYTTSDAYRAALSIGDLLEIRDIADSAFDASQTAHNRISAINTRIDTISNGLSGLQTFIADCVEPIQQWDSVAALDEEAVKGIVIDLLKRLGILDENGEYHPQELHIDSRLFDRLIGAGGT